VFAKILLLEWLNTPGGAQLRHGAFALAAPFRRREVASAYAARNQVLTVIPDDAEEFVIGLKNSTVYVGHKDPDDVRVDQAPDFSFTIREVAIKPRILQRDRRLRRKQLQYRDALRRENMRCQIVLKVENADELPLIDQWQTENGTDATLNDVGIGRKRIL